MLSAIVAGPCSVRAQQYVVVPAGNENVEGNAADREPFGHSSLRHLTYIHRDHLTSIPTWASINRISYRRDTTVPDSVMRRQPGIWQIRLGRYHGPVAQPPSAWPSSSDPDWGTVFQPRQISFPDLWQPGGSGPASFALEFPLDAPFSYSGSHLGIEHFVADGQMMFHYYVDAVDGAAPGGTVDLLPGTRGCPSGQNRAAGQAPNPGGGDLELYLFGGPTNANVALALGSSDRTWSGANLPLDLTGVGLAGCSIAVSLDLMAPAATSSAGLAEWRWQVPSLRSMLGATIFAQWMCTGDPRVNPLLPLATSDAMRCTMGTSLGGSLVGMSVVSANSGSNQVGYVQPNRGPIVRIGW